MRTEYHSQCYLQSTATDYVLYSAVLVHRLTSPVSRWSSSYVGLPSVHYGSTRGLLQHCHIPGWHRRSIPLRAQYVSTPLTLP